MTVMMLLLGVPAGWAVLQLWLERVRPETPPSTAAAVSSDEVLQVQRDTITAINQVDKELREMKAILMEIGTIITKGLQKGIPDSVCTPWSKLPWSSGRCKGFYGDGGRQDAVELHGRCKGFYGDGGREDVVGLHGRCKGFYGDGG